LQFLARTAAGAARRRFGEPEVVAGESAAMQRLAARADPARWAALREEIGQGFTVTDQLNLDRKQAMLGAFLAVEGLAR
jgi:DNA polymerase-3 subunit delta'